jgi:hypothetical protein
LIGFEGVVRNAARLNETIIGGGKIKNQLSFKINNYTIQTKHQLKQQL